MSTSKYVSVGVTRFANVPESQTMEDEKDRAGENPGTPCADPNALPNQPGCICGGAGTFCHQGTEAWPAYDGMLDAGDVSGVYQDPRLSCCTVNVKGVPAVGFLCMIQQCYGCPICCYAAPFNCIPGYWGKASGGYACSVGACGRGGPKAAPCLPDSLTLAGTWFCVPCGMCFDFHDNDTMLSSICCFCPRVHRKIKQGTIIC